MFADDFNPVTALAGEDCPRCRARGLVPATDEDCDNVRPGDRAQELSVMCPSIAARCPVCGLVGEWPAMCMPPPQEVTP